MSCSVDQAAFSDIRLYTNKDVFVLRTKDEKNILSINRKTNAISTVAGEAENAALKIDAGTVVNGVLGTLKLLSGNYLLLIKEKVIVAELFGNKIYRIGEPLLIPFNIDHETLLSAEQLEDERKYVDLIKLTFANQAFYFSYTYDCTTHLQTWFKSDRKSLWREADDHFMWNKHMAKDLISAEAEGWIIPIIRGFVHFTETKNNSAALTFGLLSRLGWKRVGTRYNTRGADKAGNVANYVETEQVAIHDGILYSFMQVRGSIPLKWSQKPNLTYKPKLKITNNASGTNPFQIHFKNQLDRYDRVVIVNLINATGSEGKLGDAFQNQHAEFKNPNINFVSFDFHHKTKASKHGALNELIGTVQDSINDFGYCKVDLKSKTVLKEQTGVLRVNCIDCLDRTNVCESLFGRVVLANQLRDKGILKEKEAVTDTVEKLFKNTWADNGDALSMLYAGTGALKSDYTRTGKRTFQGVLNDGYNSATRYYYNNFSDGFKEDGMALILGKYIVEKTDVSPFTTNKVLQTLYTVCKYTFIVSLIMVLLNFIWLFGDANKMQRLTTLGIWVAVTFVDYIFLILNGRKIVNKPVLKRKIVIGGSKPKKE